MIVWRSYNNGNGDGTQEKNCYVALGFRFQDLRGKFGLRGNLDAREQGLKQLQVTNGLMGW